MQRSAKTRLLIILQSALLLALATVLSFITILKLPYGGSVTLLSMLPIIYFSLMYGAKWGLLNAFAYSLLQMLLGFYAPPVQDFLSFAEVILLDYVIAFGILGCAGIFYRMFKSSPLSAAASAAIVIALRFLCHFLSGIIIWYSYAPEGQPVWYYSLYYNGSYMGIELILTAIAAFILRKAINPEKLKAAQ